jgi:hypothetical protein
MHDGTYFILSVQLPPRSEQQSDIAATSGRSSVYWMLRPEADRILVLHLFTSHCLPITARGRAEQLIGTLAIYTSDHIVLASLKTPRWCRHSPSQQPRHTLPPSCDLRVISCVTIATTPRYSSQSTYGTEHSYLYPSQWMVKCVGRSCLVALTSLLRSFVRLIRTNRTNHTQVCLFVPPSLFVHVLC